MLENRILMGDGVAEIRLHRLGRETGGLRTAQDLAYRLGVPEVFGPKELKIAQQDCEILGDMLKQQPDKVQQMLNDVVRSNMPRAASCY